MNTCGCAGKGFEFCNCPARAAIAQQPDLDALAAQIMNLRCEPTDSEAATYERRTAYAKGHRDARHAAAELVGAAIAQPAEPERLTREQWLRTEQHARPHGETAAQADAQPVAPEFDHSIGEGRFRVEKGAFWWHILIGEGTAKVGKFHSKLAAEDVALKLLTAFRDGAYMQWKAAAPPAPQPAADAQPVAVRTRHKASVADAAAMEPSTDPHWLWTTTHGDHAVKTAQEMVKAGAWGHMEVEFLCAAAPPARQPLDHVAQELAAAHAAPRIQWPADKAVGRTEDMGQGHLRIVLDSDNDVCVTVWDGQRSAGVEFCNPGGGGGGRSSRTRMALIALMVAMEADNAESPSLGWPGGIGREGE